MKMFVLPALLAASLAIGQPASADPHDGKGGKGGPKGHHAEMAEKHMERMLERLDLSPDQKQRLQALRERYRASAQPTRQSLRQKWQELSQLMKSPTATREQALAKQRELNQLQAQLAEARVNAWFEARAVLTPEQLRRLESLKPGGRRGAFLDPVTSPSPAGHRR